MQGIPPLTHDEIIARRLLEEKIINRSDGRVGDGRDLKEIRDRALYRDHPSFEAYIWATFEVKSTSAYRWMDAADVISETIRAASPKGEADDPAAWKVLQRHRSETACRELANFSGPDRWKIYRTAFRLARGREPKPRFIKMAAMQLGLLEETVRLENDRTVAKIRAIQSITAVRDRAWAAGRKEDARMLQDALRRLGAKPRPLGKRRPSQ